MRAFHNAPRCLVPATGMLALAGVLAAGGCADDPTGPSSGPTPASELTFLREAGEAPPLLTHDTSVVATAGQDTELRIFYAPDPGSGQTTGDLFLELDLDDGTLLQRPDGTPFAPGDSVTIRVTVDPELLRVDLQPAGLAFDPAEPAELELRYRHADRDFDDDGDEDADDATLEGEIDMWRQEEPGEPWFRVGTIRDIELDRIKADLEGFSRYALAI